jgi:predicted HTH transcriptional regulator
MTAQRMKKLGGWWRLWIALPAIWFVTVGIIFAVAWIRIDASNAKRVAISYGCVSFNGRQSLDLSSDSVESLRDQLANVSTSHAKYTDNTFKQFDPPIELIKSCISAKEFDYAPDAAKGMRFDIYLGVALALITSFAALGLLIAWVRRGFSKTSA